MYLPKVGMTMEEGTLCRWLLPDGASVAPGQAIFEMETEKVEMEVEAEGEGLLKHLVEEGTKLKPGDVVGCLLAPGEAVPPELLTAVARQSADAAPSEAPPAAPPSPAGTAERLRISPVARRLAQEAGIDPSSLRGSGPDGRVLEQDVRDAIARRTAAAPPPVPAQAAPASSPPRPGATVPYTGVRRTIGERMLQSLQQSAQLTLTSEVHIDDALRMVHGLNREWRREGIAVTLTALVVRACALALREHPRLNSRLAGSEIVLLEDVNVGIAVDTPAGLMVPVVAAADRSPLKQVAAAVAALGEKARTKTLAVEDVTGGTFTVTSLEAYGVDAFTPVLNPPQSAILGLGRVREVATFEGATPVRRQATTLSLTIDHRIVDGGPAAQFLARVAELLSRPYLLM